MAHRHIIKTTLDRKLLLKAKKYIDNGFNDKQTAAAVGIGVSTVACVRRGNYGPMPEFDADPVLKKQLGIMGFKSMDHRLHLRRVREWTEE